ncbi:MAG: SH3 domain-containing protein, partial [Propionibacteriaceae bacterium]|nr:SH3 domain-containing protein [Propionibacteriaceae bacterium]
MLARLAALTAIAFAGLTVASSAAEIAYTKSASNLREGPGTSYDIITTLPKNAALWVEACTATWCAVTTEDEDEGFIAKSLLKKSPSGPDIPFSIKIIIGPEGPFLDFGDIFDKPSPPPKPSYPEVCFYQQANFKGANFCVEDGDVDNDIPGSFDNNIESIL